VAAIGGAVVLFAVAETVVLGLTSPQLVMTVGTLQPGQLLPAAATATLPALCLLMLGEGLGRV
jgi:hypothetical protein